METRTRRHGPLLRPPALSPTTLCRPLFAVGTVVVVLWLIVALWLGVGVAAAANGQGWLLQVATPLTGEQDLQLKQQITILLERWRTAADQQPNATRPLLALHFLPQDSPDGEATASGDFERSLSLARFLTSPQVGRLRTGRCVNRADDGTWRAVGACV